MECSDRIAFAMSESSLKPVRLMAEIPQLAATTIRTVIHGRRFNLTVAKTWPSGITHPPEYRWSFHEVDEAGIATRGHITPDSFSVASGSSVDPEQAYWTAVDAIARLVYDTGIELDTLR